MNIFYWIVGISVGLFLMYKLGIVALLVDLIEIIVEVFTDIDL